MLPTKKSEKVQDLLSSNTLLYGLPKIGKTTWAASWNGGENVLFLATEQGHNHVEVYKVDIKKWEDFKTVASELVKQENPYKLLVVDTVDIAWKLCEQYVCAKNGITHASDLGFGKGYTLIKDEWLMFWTKVNQHGFPVLFISHAKEREFKSKTKDITYMDCTLTASARDIVCSAMDYIFYYYINENSERVIRTKPHKHVNAGDRSGKLPEVMAPDYEKIQEILKS